MSQPLTDISNTVQPVLFQNWIPPKAMQTCLASMCKRKVAAHILLGTGHWKNRPIVFETPNEDGTNGVDETLLREASGRRLVDGRQQHPFKKEYSKF